MKMENKTSVILRRTYQRLVTNLCNQVKELINSEKPGREEVVAIIDKIKQLKNSLSELNEKVLVKMVEKNLDECEKRAEYEMAASEALALAEDFTANLLKNSYERGSRECKLSVKVYNTSGSAKITDEGSVGRMECPGMANFRISSPDEAKNNQDDRNYLFSHKSNLRTKVTTVTIEREDGNLGITLRGGFQQNVDRSEPVTITQIRPDGPVARESTIKCGDRLLAVDGVPLQGRSLSEAQALLRQPTPSTLLTIEYDVNVLDAVEYAYGPLLIEMELNSFNELGIRLGHNENFVFIENVKPGSIADRCGALHVGDEILAINSTRIDCTALGTDDIIKFIESSCPVLRLEILPSHASLNYSNIGTWTSKEYLLSPGSTLSGVSTLKSITARRNQDCKSIDLHQDMQKTLDLNSSAANPTGFRGSNVALTHSETILTTIHRENGVFGLSCMNSEDGLVIISNVINGSPADRSQCLYPGDRILSINGRNVALENISATEINELLDGKSNNVQCTKLSLYTEFDVLDSVVPTSGIFTVKLAKRGTSGLGITITASKTSGFTVCEMKKGSIAYRAGSLIPGDKILEINNISLNQCSVEYAAHILHQSSNVVTLRVQRKDSITDTVNVRKVTYTVELQRYGGPLGITIAGSEKPFHPITISGLSAGGLGEQTGVLHVGDEILAINDHSLYGEPLSKAHQLLQNSPDFVTLKISRSITPCTRFSNNISPILPPSVDSAVESWDSSRLDLTSSPDCHIKNLRDTKDSTKRNTKAKELWSPLSGHYPSDVEDNPKKPEYENEIPDLSLLDEITSENLKIKKELDLLSLKLDAECKVSDQVTNENSESIKDQEDTAYPCARNKIQKSEQGVNSQCENLEGDDVKSGNNTNYVDLNAIDGTDLKNYSNGCKEEGNELAENDFENLGLNYLSDSKNWFKSHYLGSEINSESILNEYQSSQLYKVTLHKDPIYEDFGFSVSDGLYERGVFINRIRKGGPADLNNTLKPYDRILQVNETFTQDFDCCLTVPLIASAGDTISLLVARSSSGYLLENVSESDKVLQQEYLPNLQSLENDSEASQRILV